MEDHQIVELYRKGDEKAVAESEAKYGPYCIRIARNILDHMQEAEGCTQGACKLAMEEPLPANPAHMESHLGKITRRLSLDLFKARKAAKRGDSLFQASLDELNECIPAGSTGFGRGFDDETEAGRVGACINRFLRKQPGEARDVFICRYFYSESIGEISRRFGLAESRVNALLRRTRRKLAKFLESEGIRL